MLAIQNVSRFVLLIMTIFFVATGCHSDLPNVPAKKGEAKPDSFNEVADRPRGTDSSNVAPDLSPAPVVRGVTTENQRKPDVSAQQAELVAGVNQFGCDLYRAISNGEDNLFFSPHSLYTVLAMVYAGARGETESEIKETVHFDLERELLHPAISQLNVDLTESKNSKADKFELRVANSIWAQQDFPFLSPYLDTLSSNYGEGIRLVDFIKKESREMARLQINQWIEKETNGNITNMLPPEKLNEDTRLALVNAIFFDALWKHPFPNPSRNGKFKLRSGDEVDVPMMSLRFDVRATDRFQTGDDQLNAIELDYRGDRASMLVIMPPKGQFKEFEQSLNPEKISDIRDSLKKDDTKLFLPKFEFRAKLDLPQVLSEMGMPLAFSPTQADFSGMFEISKSRRLYLAHLLHEALVRVDEKGTTAAAATIGLMEITSMPRRFLVNRPFLFCILDSKSGQLLFIGRVMDPR